MPLSNEETSELLIRCPACGQRFKVGVELRDRMVECGACEQRFRINDEVIVRAKKFYPGERAEVMPNRYHRVPISAPLPEGLQTVHYAEQGDFTAFEPTTPLRLIAGAGAVVGVLLMAMLLFFGAKSGGALDGMGTANRLVMGGFTAVIAGVLLVYANPRARVRAMLGAVFCASLLLALPLFRTEGSGTAGRKPGWENPPLKPRPAAVLDPEAERIARVRDEIGTAPLEQEQLKLKEAGSERRAYGVWLRGLSEEHKLLVRDYFLRAAGAETSHPYPRDRNQYLMVVSGLKMEIEQLVEYAKPLGEVVAVYREIGVIEVQVNAGYFQAGSVEKLSDRTDPAFYELNKRELESIDLDRVEKAVVRLADVEPKLYRSDIARRLVVLLTDNAVEFKAEICDALVTWSEESTNAGEPAEALLKHLDETKAAIPTSLVALLAKEKRAGAIPVVLRLWKLDGSHWESLLLAFGPAAEAALIESYPSMDIVGRKSTVEVLGKVGGRDSLPLLEAAREGADREMKVRIENAAKAIHERLGE